MSMRISSGWMLNLGFGFPKWLLCALVALGVAGPGLASATSTFTTKLDEYRDQINIVIMHKIDSDWNHGHRNHGPQIIASRFDVFHIGNHDRDDHTRFWTGPSHDQSEFAGALQKHGSSHDDDRGMYFGLSHSPNQRWLNRFKQHEFGGGEGHYGHGRGHHNRHHGKPPWHGKPPPVVPEPTTALLMSLGLAGLSLAARRVRP